MLRHSTRRLSPGLIVRGVVTRRTLATSIHYADSSQSGFFTPSPPLKKPQATNSVPPESPFPNRNASGGGNKQDRISDHEYNVRVGRAFDLLRATIPEFMRTGLVDYNQNQSLSQSSGLTLLDVFTFRALRANLSSASSETEEQRNSLADQVYDPAIQFRFLPGPPASSSSSPSSPSASSNASEPLLTEEEAASLSFSGRSLYFASAHILRHTLNVLFADSTVELRKIRLECRGSSPRVDDVLHLRLGFTGHLRVTGQEQNYTLVFRYDIDPETGRIIRHTVERVEPAIGRKLWTVLATVWQRVIGHEPMPAPAACNAHMERMENLQRVVSGQEKEEGSGTIWSGTKTTSAAREYGRAGR